MLLLVYLISYFPILNSFLSPCAFSQLILFHYTIIILSRGGLPDFFGALDELSIIIKDSIFIFSKQSNTNFLFVWFRHRLSCVWRLVSLLMDRWLTRSATFQALTHRCGLRWVVWCIPVPFSETICNSKYNQTSAHWPVING